MIRRVSILCVGKLKEPFYIDAVSEYAKRLRRFCKLDVQELPEERLPDRPSRARIDAALAKEAAAIREKLPGGGKIVALCIEGQLCSSEELSRRMENYAGTGDSRLTFLLGGSYGLHDSAKALADWKLSLSPMTFPHHLARVMLLEQLYRAYQISAGGQYHK